MDKEANPQSKVRKKVSSLFTRCVRSEAESNDAVRRCLTQSNAACRIIALSRSPMFAPLKYLSLERRAIPYKAAMRRSQLSEEALNPFIKPQATLATPRDSPRSTTFSFGRSSQQPLNCITILPSHGYYRLALFRYRRRISSGLGYPDHITLVSLWRHRKGL